MERLIGRIIAINTTINIILLFVFHISFWYYNIVIIYKDIIFHLNLLTSIRMMIVQEAPWKVVNNDYFLVCNIQYNSIISCQPL